MAWYTLRNKGAKVSLLYPLSTNMYLQGTNMDFLGTKVHLLKRYHPSDSFCTFFLRVYSMLSLPVNLIGH